jgi:hypothetical protein
MTVLVRLFCCLILVLAHRFEHFEGVADIDKSIEVLEKVSHQLTDNNPSKTTSLISICICAPRLDDIADIDKAITINNQVQLLPSDLLMDNLVVQSQCCRAHANRYKCCRDVADIEKAILAGERALRLISPNNPKELTHLTNLGNSYPYRFEAASRISTRRSFFSEVPLVALPEAR